MPTLTEGVIIEQFVGLPKGTPLFAMIFDNINIDYNCTLVKVTDTAITVEHNGIRYRFDDNGRFDEGHGRQLYLKKPKRRFQRY